jgi:hypothetical protein
MRSFSVITCLLALGCSSATAPDEVKVVGTIVGLSEGVPQIEVPSTAQRGQAFTVRITTTGDTCTEKLETEVNVSDAVAVVTPYDLEHRGGQCHDIGRTFEHTASVTFEQAGSARVDIRGRETPGGVIVTLQRTVVVQ